MASLTRKRSSKNRVPSGKGNRFSRYNLHNRNSYNGTDRRQREYKIREHETSYNTKYMCEFIQRGEACPDKDTCKKCHTAGECKKAEWNDEIKSREKMLKKLDKIKVPNPKIVGQKAMIEAEIKMFKAKIERGIMSTDEWKNKQKELKEIREEKTKKLMSGKKIITIPTYYRVTTSKTDKEENGKNYKKAIEGSEVEVPLTSKVNSKQLLEWLDKNSEERQKLIKQRLCQELFVTWVGGKPCKHKPCKCKYGDKCPWNSVKISNYKLKNDSNIKLFKRLSEDVAKELTLCANIHEDSKVSAEDDLED